MASSSPGRITVDPSVMGGQLCAAIADAGPDGQSDAPRRHDRDGDTCGVPDLEPEDLAECVEHAATEAEDDSPGLGVKAWLADTDDLPTLEVVIETAASVQRDRAKRGE